MTQIQVAQKMFSALTMHLWMGYRRMLSETDIHSLCLDGIAVLVSGDIIYFTVDYKFTLIGGDDMQVFGRSRNVSVAPPEATTHPLLLDVSSIPNRSSTGQPRARRPQRVHTATSHVDLLQTIETLIGGNAIQLFQHVMAHEHGGNGAETIRLDVPAGALVDFGRGFLQQRRAGVVSTTLRVERAPRSGDGRSEARDFDPLVTIQRWTEEVKILHGKFVPERVSKLGNHLVLALLPAAVDAAKEAKIKEDQQREAEAKAEEEAAAKEKEEKEKEKAIEAEEVLKRDADEAERKAEMDVQNTPQEAQVGGTADTEMDDASSPSHSTLPEGQAEQTASGPSTSDIIEDSADASPNQAESSRAAERVTVMIHGSPVDITDTGIDPTFLEALPDEMREEVVNQHVRDQRAARVERPPDSQISDEFLDALPPEIRAEIIQHERLERLEHARRRVQEAASAGGNAVPADIDPASFIASLDPQLRQTVLLDQDESFIQTLPPFMIAEAGTYRDGSQVPRRQLATHTTARSVPIARKVPPPRDAIQLLDKGGVSILVRLLFFPQVLKKNHLYKVLVNLCENAKTRTELFNLILSILQDGTGDLVAVDKSFAQMSFRNSKIPSQQTPKAAGKQKSGSDYFSTLSAPNIHNEVNPDLVAQRCLEALTFIVSANELSSLFFLTEHELPPGLRRVVSKKGKGKERQLPQMHYPIVLLLTLLDRQSLLKTPSTMESVVGLLATVTRPLMNMKDTKKEEFDSTALSASTSASIVSAPPVSAPATSIPPTTELGVSTSHPESEPPSKTSADRYI